MVYYICIRWKNNIKNGCSKEYRHMSNYVLKYFSINMESLMLPRLCGGYYYNGV